MMSGDQKLISCHSACELQLEIPVFETESPGILILDVFKYLGLQDLDTEHFQLLILGPDLLGFGPWIPGLN